MATNSTNSNLSVVNQQTEDLVVTDTITLTNIFEVANKVYRILEIDVHYETDYHTPQLPVASTSVTTAVFPVLANKTMKKRVLFTIETLGNQPSIPTPFTGNSNEVLQWTDVNPRIIKSDEADLNIVWRISGEYLYGIVDPTKVTYYYPTSPNLTLTLSDTAVQSSSFKTGIVG